MRGSVIAKHSLARCLLLGCRPHWGSVPVVPAENFSRGPTTRRLALSVRYSSWNSGGGGKPLRSAAAPVLWAPLYYRVSLRITQLSSSVTVWLLSSVVSSPWRGKNRGGKSAGWVLPPSNKDSSASDFAWWAVAFKVSLVDVWSWKVRTTAEGDLWTRYSFPPFRCRTAYIYF